MKNNSAGPKCCCSRFFCSRVFGIRALLLMAVCLLLPGGVLADYAQMNKERNTYAPPDFFTHFAPSENPSSVMETKGGQKSEGNQIRSRISALKKGQAKQLASQRIPFLAGPDPTLYATLLALSADPATGPSAVSTRVGKRVVLKEVEILTALVNPGILAAQKQAAAELLSYDQITGLDDTLRQYEGFTKGLNNQAGPSLMKGSIRQGWPFPGLSGLKGKIIKEQVGIAVEKINIMQREVITQIRKAYWELVYLDESQKSTGETIDALNRLKDVATTLYKSGKTSFQDIIKINIRIQLLREELVTLASRQDSVEALLLELLNLPAGTRVGRPDKTPAQKKIGPPELLYPLARKNRQELKIIGHRINKLEHLIEMAETMILEPFTLGLSFYENDAVSTIGSNGTRGAFGEKTMAAMKNNQPQKPWYGLSDPWLNQTRQTLLSLKQTRIKEEKATDTLVQETWFLVDKNRRELDLYERKILALSKSALDVSAREYEAGAIPFSQAIDSYTFWLRVKLTIAGKKSSLGASIAALERMVGKSL
jgi:outer membrane protein, heavy metal efflux system